MTGPAPAENRPGRRRYVGWDEKLADWWFPRTPYGPATTGRIERGYHDHDAHPEPARRPIGFAADLDPPGDPAGGYVGRHRRPGTPT